MRVDGYTTAAALVPSQVAQPRQATGSRTWGRAVPPHRTWEGVRPPSLSPCDMDEDEKDQLHWFS